MRALRAPGLLALLTIVSPGRGAAAAPPVAAEATVALEAAADALFAPLARPGSPGCAAGIERPWPAGIEAPAVSVDAGVARWAPWFRPSHAEARARAVVGELEARRRAADAPPVRYRSVVALMVKVPDSTQDTPEVGLAVTRIGTDGTPHTDWYRTTAEGDSYGIVGPAEPWVDPPGD